MEACRKSLEKIDYAVRFDSEIIDETAQKLEKHITEIASGASDKLSDNWMTAINDVRMPFHLNEKQNPVSDFIEDSKSANDVIYKRGHLKLIAAPLWWTVAVKLKWNGDQDVEYLAQVFASSKFFGFQEKTGDTRPFEDTYELQMRQIRARMSHIESWLDSNCPRMIPKGQSETVARREHIMNVVIRALTIADNNVRKAQPPVPTPKASDAVGDVHNATRPLPKPPAPSNINAGPSQLSG